MSSRYYNSYHSTPHRPRSSHYSSTKTAPKSRIRESTESYTPTLGRKKPIGQWKAKKKRDKNADKETKMGEFNQETIEAELNKYKKGVFYHNDDSKSDTKNTKQLKHVNHTQTNKENVSANTNKAYSQFQLTRTQKGHPPIYSQLPRPVPPNYAQRSKHKTEDENKIETPKDAANIEETKIKDDTQYIRNRDNDRSNDHKKRIKSKAPMVTVSPVRPTGPPPPQAGPYGYYGPPPPVQPHPMDHYYGYYAGMPPPHPMDHYYGYGRDEMYASMPPRYGGQFMDANVSSWYQPYGYEGHGYAANDGSWYPYPPMGAAPATGNNDTYGAYHTPKRESKGKKSGAKVDLTTPIARGGKMSPGRRVNKIQKQLEYYFSPECMGKDRFFLSHMDSKGWIALEVLLGCPRLKDLDASKEMIIEAAYHSALIEIDAKGKRLRANKLWEQYVKDGSRKKEKRRKSDRQRERERQKALDSADVNSQTIESIVASIAKKHDRREKRRAQRDKDKDKDKKGKGKSEKSSEEPKSDKNTTETEQELIQKDKEQSNGRNGLDKGDPNHTDMVEID